MNRNNYKLIVDLPDLNKDSILVWNESENCYKCEKSIWVSPNKYAAYSAGTVTQSPQFFEEIIEKQRIMAFKSINNEIYKVTIKGNYSSIFSFEIPLQVMLKTNNLICQVSNKEGKIFTVGDIVSRVNSYNTKLRIEKFLVGNDGKLFTICINPTNFSVANLFNIDKIIEYKEEFLFTSDDGHFIFEGDIFYTVDTKQYYTIKNQAEWDTEKIVEYKRFKSEETAKKYCLEQKINKAYEQYHTLTKEYEEKYGK